MSFYAILQKTERADLSEMLGTKVSLESDLYEGPNCLMRGADVTFLRRYSTYFLGAEVAFARDQNEFREGKICRPFCVAPNIFLKEQKHWF